MKREDQAAASYNPAANDYDLAKDPRCLYGWGPPVCHHMFGHTCFRALGHPGKCAELVPDPLPCERRHRPKDWDATGRAENWDSEIPDVEIVAALRSTVTAALAGPHTADEEADRG